MKDVQQKTLTAENIDSRNTGNVYNAVKAQSVSCKELHRRQYHSKAVE